MIYVPDSQNYECFVVRNEETIRAYKEIPQNNKTIEYRDYYYNSNYYYQDGFQQFSQYTTLPVCLNNDNISNDVYYRNDFDKILVIFFIMFIFIVYFPLNIFFKFFKRRGV